MLQVGWEEADYFHCDPQLDSLKCSMMFITVNISVTLCVYLPDFTHFLIDLFNLFVSTYIEIFSNILVYGMRVHQNTWGRVSQTQNGFRKRDDEISKFSYETVKRLFSMDASGSADEPWQFFCACTVVFPPKWWSRHL